jgi:tetratricopeptide (TPR) repeat protein
MRTVDDEALLQLVVSTAAADDFKVAADHAGAIVDRTTAVEAMFRICDANANSQRSEEAVAAVAGLLELRTDSHVLGLELAASLESRGREYEALHLLDSLARSPKATPALYAHLGRSLEYAGRTRDAEARVTEALSRWPTEAALHALLAELRWRSGAGEALTAPLEDVLDRNPGEWKLRLVAADALRNAGYVDRAIGLLQEGLRHSPDSPAFLTSIGVLLDSQDRTTEALAYLRDAVARAPGSISTRRNLVPTLLRLGQSREALQINDELLRRMPDDQQLIAWRATALRALGDSEYARLHDYDRLVHVCRLRPGGDRDIARFNAEFARELSALHRADRRPLAQSLRGGSQTERNLPTSHKVIADFFAMLDSPIRDYIAALARLGPDHPAARRLRGGYRISGSWSVQLQPGGFHLDHVHPAGWVSSAYYVELPELPEDGSREGWLAFGKPGVAIPGLGADHFVRPEPGLLVLFPSYMWHGTVPFTGEGRRLTAAFDVVPA